MKPSYGTALGIGAAAGLVLSTVLLLFAGATGAVTTMGIVGEGQDIEPAFSTPASALWIVVLLMGGVGGLVLAITTRAIARVIDPDAKSVPSGVIGAIGLVVGAVVAIAVLPVGVTVLGSVSDGTATVTVIQMVLLASIVGVAGGAAVTWLSYIMARPPQHAADEELLAA